MELLMKIGAVEGETNVMLDRRCRELTEDLRQVPGVSVEPVRIEAAVGTKAGIAEVIGTIAVSGAATASVKLIADVVVAYINRSGSSSITLRRGDVEVVVQGKSSPEQEEMVNRLLGEPE